MLEDGPAAPRQIETDDKNNRNSFVGRVDRRNVVEDPLWIEQW